DFEGQKLSDLLSRTILMVGTILSFIVGFALQSLGVTFGGMAASAFIVVVTVLPPWPMYNQHAVHWLPVLDTTDS
ncbi:hypothetical protein FISHEDRAFT_13034, partial [Fistulina hepatica ATCC 64428]